MVDRVVVGADDDHFRGGSGQGAARDLHVELTVVGDVHDHFQPSTVVGQLAHLLARVVGDGNEGNVGSRAAVGGFDVIDEYGLEDRHAIVRLNHPTI